MVEALIRTENGIYSETGKCVAVFTRGAWYALADGGEMVVCSPEKSATYRSMPITGSIITRLVRHGVQD